MGEEEEKIGIGLKDIDQSGEGVQERVVDESDEGIIGTALVGDVVDILVIPLRKELFKHFVSIKENLLDRVDIKRKVGIGHKKIIKIGCGEIDSGKRGDGGNLIIKVVKIIDQIRIVGKEDEKIRVLIDRFQESISRIKGRDREKLDDIRRGKVIKVKGERV